MPYGLPSGAFPEGSCLFPGSFEPPLKRIGPRGSGPIANLDSLEKIWALLRPTLTVPPLCLCFNRP